MTKSTVCSHRESLRWRGSLLGPSGIDRQHVENVRTARPEHSRKFCAPRNGNGIWRLVGHYDHAASARIHERGRRVSEIRSILSGNRRMRTERIPRRCRVELDKPYQSVAQKRGRDDTALREYWRESVNTLAHIAPARDPRISRVRTP